MNSPIAPDSFSSTAFPDTVLPNTALPTQQQNDFTNPTTNHSIAFVDAGLDYADSLIEGLQNTRVVLLDGQQDGVEQITSVLSEQRNLDSVHIFSHGEAGRLQLGDSVIDSGGLEAYGRQFQAWGEALSDDADLLFYGCNLGAGEVGSAFANRISELTGADAAASNNLTGIGGDWQLEVVTGEIESAIALSETAQASYRGTLVATLDNGSFELGLQGWNQWSGTEQVTDSERVAGEKSLQLTAAISGVNQFVTATAGSEYTLSATAKSSSDRYVGVGFKFFDADYNKLEGGVGERIVGADWQEYGGSAIAPEGTRYLQAWAYKHSENGTAFIDDFSLSVSEASNDETEPPTPTDTTAPSATLNANDINTAGNSSYEFTVTYSDDTAVDTSTFNSRDIRVSGPNGFNRPAIFAGRDSREAGEPQTVTYSLDAPGDLWDGDDNGLYSVFLQPNQVSDTAGNSSNISVSLGDFTVGLQSDTLPLGPLNSGVAVSDDATGTGYLMHSQELVPVRFLGAGPAAGNAGNLIAVQYRDDQWYYDNDNRQVAFTPRSSDRLLAELDFSVDSATLLVGTRSTINGVDSGYESGDLSITPNYYAEEDDIGEFEVSGREVVLYGQGDLVPGQLSFREPSITIDEAAGTVELVVDRLGGSDGTVIASYATTSVSAFAAEDYETVAGGLIFDEGETQKTISVAILDDAEGETDEVFSISLNDIRGGASIGRGSATVVISENDGGLAPSSAGDLLPDLVPIASTSGDYSIDTNEIPGQVLLRLSTEVANAGDGPLELWGVDTTAATQAVFQRIYDDEGGDRDQLAGEFVNYTSHGHFHFEGFATYNLREKNADDSVGAIVASGGKTSFCLININQPFPELTESAVVADGRGGDDCGFIQGIDVGYADVYGKRLPNQWVDVTSVPDGDYWLEITTDPDNNILESDESNNTAYLEVSLDNPQFV